MGHIVGDRGINWRDKARGRAARSARGGKNALGSYADRIKDANGKSVAIKSGTPDTPALSPKVSQSNMATSNGAPRSRQPKAENGRSQDEKSDEDGSWETVPTKGQRAKPEVKEKRSAANTSRNWRERPNKDDDETSSRHCWLGDWSLLVLFRRWGRSRRGGRGSCVGASRAFS
jgi:hypothetical protein